MTWPVRLGIAALAAALTACATPGTAGSGRDAGQVETPGAVAPVGGSATGAPAAQGELMGQGTVLQAGDAAPEFCLGGVMESYPPQCSGPPIADWDWALAEQSETASGVTWGTYAVTGRWDGRVFTRTGRPIPLSLYDAMPFEDPFAGRQGTTSEQELERIQREVYLAHEGYAVSAGTESGFVSVTVIYDDGSFQARMDAAYGPDVVVVQSALRPTP